MAKCPQCGREISEGTHCKTCGMEIHYKDFRGSELLDIKIPSSSSHSQEAEQRSTTEGKNDDNALNLPSAKKPRLNKMVFFSLAVIVIIIAAISWYYLLKFLLKF
ncbi:MAG: hypothetical protein FIA94_08265 [Nitrospirae bacterium]|nr:hypothetical protein [Nitrospirota bacterium]